MFLACRLCRPREYCLVLYCRLFLFKFNAFTWKSKSPTCSFTKRRQLFLVIWFVGIFLFDIEGRYDHWLASSTQSIFKLSQSTRYHAMLLSVVPNAEAELTKTASARSMVSWSACSRHGEHGHMRDRQERPSRPHRKLSNCRYTKHDAERRIKYIWLTI